MSRLKGIDPGRLNKRVTIMRYADTTDDMGNTVNVLEPLRTVWAEIRPTRGKEGLEYYKDKNSEMYKVTVRMTDVTEKDVLVFKGRQFLINYVTNPLEAGYYLEIFCTEEKDHEVEEASDE